MTGTKSYNDPVRVFGAGLRRQLLARKGGSAFLVWRGSVGCACRSEREQNLARNSRDSR
jgi:hypothetical protein